MCACFGPRLEYKVDCRKKRQSSNKVIKFVPQLWERLRVFANWVGLPVFKHDIPQFYTFTRRMNTCLLLDKLNSSSFIELLKP